MTGYKRPRVYLDGIPQDLKAIPRWICWCAERRGDKMTKIPKDPRTGGNAKSTDPSTWADFDTAVRAWDQGRGRFDGIGFIFGEDRAYTGLDLDHVLLPGSELMDEYRWVVEEAGTYTEVSPSGDGLHLIFRGPKPEGATRCRRTQPGGKQVVEMYEHDRFFTVTGNRYSGTDPIPPSQIRENPDALERASRVWIDGGQQPTLPAARQQARPQYGNGAQLDDEQVDRGHAALAQRRADHGAHVGRHERPGRRRQRGGPRALQPPGLLVRQGRGPDGPDLPQLRPHARQVGHQARVHHLRAADHRAGNRGLHGRVQAPQEQEAGCGPGQGAPG